jgi:hypothetical protein
VGFNSAFKGLILFTSVSPPKGLSVSVFAVKLKFSRLRNEMRDLSCSFT